MFGHFAHLHTKNLFCRVQQGATLFSSVTKMFCFAWLELNKMQRICPFLEPKKHVGNPSRPDSSGKKGEMSIQENPLTTKHFSYHVVNYPY